MNNLYFKFRDHIDLQRKYQSVFEKLEESLGEETDEIIIAFKEIEEDFQELIWDIYNLIELEKSDIERREKEIKRLSDKNKSSSNSIDFYNKFLVSLVKDYGNFNKNSNKNIKVNDVSFTVASKTSYDVEESFSDERFINFSLKSKISKEHADKISVYLQQRGLQNEMEITIDKKGLASAISEGEKIENVITNTKEYLIKK